MARGGSRGSNATSKHMAPHLRRRLSEEGKRLLRRALAHEDDEQGSVDFSIVTDRDDASADSDLDSFFENEQPANVGGGGGTSLTKKKLAAQNKWKAQQYGGDAERDDELENAIDELTEKRDTTKIRALQKILSQLCGSVMTDSVQASKVTLTSNLLACLKKRLTDSGALALRALGVLALTLGNDEQEFYDDVCVPLQRLVTDDAEPSLRVEALYALSIACVVCCREEQQQWELLDVLGHVLLAAKDAEDAGDEWPDTLVIAALECWALLVSAFRASVVAPKVYDESSILFDHVAAIAAFVRDGESPSVRAAACEVLALLVQDKYALSPPGWSYDLEDAASPIGGLTHKITQYMKESAKSVGKKTRRTQRSLLKDVLETLESGAGPHEELQVDGDMLSVATWRCHFQAHVFRRALQSGFQVHVVENAVLRSVFNVAEKRSTRMSMVPTTTRRAGHKSKAVHKRNEVSRKDMAQNAFLFDD